MVEFRSILLTPAGPWIILGVGMLAATISIAAAMLIAKRVNKGEKGSRVIAITLSLIGAISAAIGDIGAAWQSYHYIYTAVILSIVLFSAITAITVMLWRAAKSVSV